MYAFTYNASCHSDGSGDTSHREKVEGYIQPSVTHQLRYDHIVRVYRVHWELFDGIFVMHTIINDEMMLHHLSSLLRILSHHHLYFTSCYIIITASHLIKHNLSNDHLHFTSYHIISPSHLIKSSSSLQVLSDHHLHYTSWWPRRILSNHHLRFKSYHIISASHIFSISFHLSYHNHCFISSSSLHNFSALHLTT